MAQHSCWEIAGVLRKAADEDRLAGPELLLHGSNLRAQVGIDSLCQTVT